MNEKTTFLPHLYFYLFPRVFAKVALGFFLSVNIAPIFAQTAINGSQELATNHALNTSEVQTIIDNYRRILSLQGYSAAPNTSAIEKQEARQVGEALFLQNEHLKTNISELLILHSHQPDNKDIGTFIAAITAPQVQDADLFAVRSVVTDIAKKAQLNLAETKAIRKILRELANAHIKYGQELNAALSQQKISKAKPERPAWVAYIAQVEQQFPAQQLLADLNNAPPSEPNKPPLKPAEPIETKEPPKESTAEKTPPLTFEQYEVMARKNEWMGLQLEKGQVLLTFDDGPHPTYTKEILAILARYKVKAIFFQLGQNLGTVNADKAELNRNQEIEKELLSAGHAIANHSFTHPLLPKLTQAQVQQEIDKTQALLNLIITDDNHRTHLFRAPYGGRNSMILGELGERGLRSVLWNVDSLDWSDPIPESIVHRILQELDHDGRGIILMHDIHPKTVLALPILLDELIKRDYHFVHWEGGNLVPTVRDEVVQNKTPVTH